MNNINKKDKSEYKVVIKKHNSSASIKKPNDYQRHTEYR
jgi:hypothetical protein